MANVNTDLSAADRQMGRIWLELLTKATLCAATMGLIAGLAALFLGS